MNFYSIILSFIFVPTFAFAQLPIKNEPIPKTQKKIAQHFTTLNLPYASGSTKMEGFLAWDPSPGAPKKAVLIVHDWMGLGDQAKEVAKKLASEGFIALAVDVYGKGNRPKDAKEAGQFASKYKNDRKLLRAHMRAAYDALISTTGVDPKKIAVMGYCFGGTSALELARSGAVLAGTASFHGGLANPNPEDAKNIKAPVLVMHGEDDPFVPKEEVEAFKKEMSDAKAKLHFVSYPGAVHAFTNKSAGTDNSKGAAYNAVADAKSWREFENFLSQLLK